MATRADLVRKTLKNLGVWQAGQDLPPEDYKAVDDELPTLLLALSRSNVYNASVTNIPDEAVDAIADWLAGRLVKTFGIQGEELAGILRDAGAAETSLRYLNTMPATYGVVRGVYF